MMQGKRNIVLRNSNALTGDNLSGVGTFDHTMQRYARFAFAVNQNPV